MVASGVAFGSLPFKEQIAFLRAKRNVLTEAWTDVWESEHDHAFMIAGANRIDLLVDLRAAVERAISEGTGLEAFRRDFDRIVAKYGWQYKGGRNWRTRVIFETNLRTSYAAGRYAQLQALKRVMPYWRYRHSDAVMHPRPAHQAWDRLVLLADDPWWDTHFPPNGWGCQCTVEGLDERGLKRMGKSGPDEAPPVNMQTVLVGKNGPHPRTVQTPAGVDPGFGYAPGKSAFGGATPPRPPGTPVAPTPSATPPGPSGSPPQRINVPRTPPSPAPRATTPARPEAPAPRGAPLDTQTPPTPPAAAGTVVTGNGTAGTADTTWQSVFESLTQSVLRKATQLPALAGAEALDELLALPRVAAALDDSVVATPVISPGDRQTDDTADASGVLVGALDPVLVRGLQALGVTPPTAPIAASAATLAAASSSTLPAALRNADIVLFDKRTGNLLFVGKGLINIVRLGEGAAALNTYAGTETARLPDLRARLVAGDLQLMKGQL